MIQCGCPARRGARRPEGAPRAGNMLIAVNPYKPLTMPLAGHSHPCFIYGREEPRPALDPPASPLVLSGHAASLTPY